MLIWENCIDPPLPISCVWVMYWPAADCCSLDMARRPVWPPHHTQIIPSQARGVNCNSWGLLHMSGTSKFTTTWNHGSVAPVRPPRVSMCFCCGLRQSCISFSHSFMNSSFMYISQQVSNPGGPGTALHYSPASRHPYDWAFNCFLNCASFPPSLLSHHCLSQDSASYLPPTLPSNTSPSTPCWSPPYFPPAA